MNLQEFLTGISFRFVGSDSAPDNQGWFKVTRVDGSPARLLGLPGMPLDLFNATLPGNESQLRSTLRGLCSIPKMSTFALGAIVNQVVARMPSDQAFVNVGVWNGFTFLCGIAGNPDRPCVGLDNFSQFGGPREAFLARFNALKSPRHQFHDNDYIEYFARKHQGQIGFYIYDGEHSYANQLKGLQVAEPFFADGCLVLVDDTNWIEPWQATLDFVGQSSHEYQVLFDQTTCCNGHPSFWNGVLILQRLGRKLGVSKNFASSGSNRRPEAAQSKPSAVVWNQALAPEQRRQVSLVSLVLIHCNPDSDMDAAIASALGLTYPNVQVVVVDAVCSEGSREITAGYASRLAAVRETGDANIASAFQTGLNTGHGHWVCFADSDQAVVPTAIEIALNSGGDGLGRSHSNATHSTMARLPTTGRPSLNWNECGANTARALSPLPGRPSGGWITIENSPNISARISVAFSRTSV